MKVESKECVVLKVSDIERLDPLTITLEDISKGAGRIIISCYTKAWNSYWGGMGDKTIAEFFIRCDNHYLAKNLSDISSTIVDHENFDKWLKSELIQRRKDKDFSANEARRLFDDIEDNFDSDERWQHTDAFYELAREVAGEEFWHSIPEAPNHEYTYLCRIIDATREALKVHTESIREVA